MAGCSTGSSNSSAEAGPIVASDDVSLPDGQFDPRNIEAPVGAIVTWTNDGQTSHTVTAASDNWSFDQTVPAGTSTEFSFTDSGVYDVYCRFHGSHDLTGMSMNVTVGRASIDAPLGLTDPPSTALM
ncbi:MAG: cupredoxin domain-containing protein [Halobacteriales archaeon]